PSSEWVWKKHVASPSQLRQAGTDLGVELGLVPRAARRFGPLVERFAKNVNVAFVRRHRISCDVARSDAGEDAGDSRELAKQRLFQFEIGPHRFIQTHPDRFVEHRRDRPFVELWHKLGAKMSE